MKRIIVFAVILTAFTAMYAEIVGDIKIVNNTYTDPGFIKKQVTVSTGDTVSFSDLEESVKNIRRMEIFGKILFQAVKTDSSFMEFVDIESLSGNNAGDTVTLHLTAKEMLLIMPSAGAEFNLPETWMIRLGISFEDLFRRRHKIEALFTFGTVREFAVNYFIPTLYSRKYNLEVKSAYSTVTKNILGIEELHRNITVGGGYTFSPNITPLILIGFDRLTLKDDTFSHAYQNNFAQMYDEFLISGFKVKFDYRDNPFYPENGLYSEIYYKNDRNWWNVPIDRNYLRFDLRNYSTVPGGVFAIRSLLFLQSGTLAYYDNIQPEALENRAADDSLITGLNRITLSAEYRYSIRPLYMEFDLPVAGSFSMGTMLVAFADFSYISPSLSTFNPAEYENYRGGVGAGIRLYSGIFNILGIDVGYNINKRGLDGIKYNLAVFSWNF
ncbi:MAG: hypothetical protein R6U31_06285 [bacterium]